MNFKLAALSEVYAKQICDWKYEGEYAVYNYPEWNIILKQKWGITQEEKRNKEFIAVLDKCGDLCGYIRFVDNHDFVTVGLGLKPSLCGLGFGYVFMQLIKNECEKREYQKIILEVRSFNKRAIKCYKQAGFKDVDVYNKNTLTGECEFVKMEFCF
ncbi:GNAT family N-acetyltransferase [Inconstantimicrobium mannanitabidum]|uniref:N-acetyltransferase n=1 Tax=Inconstantimicrobium mannanitabidum TaxID=1604901 RepID=A0ACB5RDE8_9CLOT|nr:GNAT family N-acetyltransferase [Clostridium sp. TW13]GKX67289.1 N-acetyltransferase [Clostridium sp. TW13]